jgi:hypothetical protein
MREQPDHVNPPVITPQTNEEIGSLVDAREAPRVVRRYPIPESRGSPGCAALRERHQGEVLRIAAKSGSLGSCEPQRTHDILGLIGQVTGWIVPELFPFDGSHDRTPLRHEHDCTLLSGCFRQSAKSTPTLACS